MAERRPYRSIYSYAWDLADEGAGAFGDRIAATGANSVSLAAAYHAGKFIRPHGRSGKVYFPEDGTVYFRHDPSAYQRIQPLPNPLLADRDPLADLARQLPDLERYGWVVCFHNTPLGRLHPDLVSRNCYGDPYWYSLNPAHPEAREYVVALCRDLTMHYDLSGIRLETPGWLPFEHGYHHEFALIRMDGWTKLLLGLDFSEATVTLAAVDGIDVLHVQKRVQAAIDMFMASDIAFTEAQAADWIASDLIADPDFMAFLRWRCKLVAQVVQEIRDVVPAGADVRVIPSVQRPSARGWIEGSDLRLLANACDGLEICAYERSAADVHADIHHVRRQTGPDARISAIMRPTYPDLANGAEVQQAARILARHGVDGLAYYNDGHMRAGYVHAARTAFQAFDESLDDLLMEND
ncbi:MAG TPA: hypothetical protein VHL31_02300 [Geminicoccus sp.]|jgi:hypothetical protein|uniref:hypothetical protein n=1 Tax=Geminicoccus sp. TaxID=2024832 RepID=UPI002E37A5BF|nr:hypothetical protein [Geminicoccus sp.]HEX2525116.1 hypothetical protein [Geminicoccus sp.]